MVADVGVLGLDLVHVRVAVDGLVLAVAALVLGDVGEALGVSIRSNECSGSCMGLRAVQWRNCGAGARHAANDDLRGRRE